MVNPPARSARRGLLTAATGLAIVSVALLWSFGPTLAVLIHRWSTDPRYSHGFLVPAFALVLLWHHRSFCPQGWGSLRDAWAGVGLLTASLAVHMAGARFYFPWVEAASLAMAAAALALGFGGRAGLIWAGPSAAFLLFMVPLPYRVEGALGAPLQGAATVCSTVALQTLGLPAFAEGNVITIDDARIGVVEACNGLGMLVTFTALASGLALIVERSWPERALIVLSAGPIALAANVARITVTGVLHDLAGAAVADAVYHDLAGWLMMPLALALLWAEFKFLALVFIPVPAGRSLRLVSRQYPLRIR